jgi:hypothetical protein
MIFRARYRTPITIYPSPKYITANKMASAIETSDDKYMASHPKSKQKSPNFAEGLSGFTASMPCQWR